MRAIGRYELIEELASGGMATVWSAKMTGADGFTRRCAVKLLHPHLARDPKFCDLFLDEARIAAGIHHPNVCQILDFGREEGTPFIAMELLEGKTLNQINATIYDRHGADWPLEITLRLATIIAEAADGLASAHESRDERGEPREIVHRDVSPQNVIVTFDGSVKVLDFGIARARDQVHETAPGEVKGKFAYMAPEQMRGDAIDARADVWALGVMLWECLACARLFRRSGQAAIVDAVQTQTIGRPSAQRPGVPAELEAVAMAALERDVSARTASARTFARELRAAVQRIATIDRVDVAAWVRSLYGMAGDDVSRTETRVPTGAMTVAAAPRSRRALYGVAALVILGLVVGIAAYVGLGPTFGGLLVITPSATPRSDVTPSATIAPSIDAAPMVALDVAAAPLDVAADGAGSSTPTIAIATAPADAGGPPRSTEGAARRRTPPLSPPPLPPPGSPPPPPTTEAAPGGSVEFAVRGGWNVRIDDGPWIEGPRRHARADAGAHRVRASNRETGEETDEVRTFEAGRSLTLP